MVKVIVERCPQNHPCPVVRKCPKKAINQKDYNAPTINQEECIKCELCIRICPYGCFQE